VLYKPLQGLKGQVETVEAGVAALQPGHRQCLGVVVESAVVREALVESALARMAERGWPNRGRERTPRRGPRRGQRAGQRAGDLSTSRVW